MRTTHAHALHRRTNSSNFTLISPLSENVHFMNDEITILKKLDVVTVLGNFFLFEGEQ